MGWRKHRRGGLDGGDGNGGGWEEGVKEDTWRVVEKQKCLKALLEIRDERVSLSEVLERTDSTDGVASSYIGDYR